MTIQQFINKYHVTTSAEWADSNPNISDMSAGFSHYKCTLRHAGRRMTLYFSQGPAICKEPSVADVLDCVASDATCALDSFGNFCREFDYDVDSRRAERTYNTIRTQTDKLRKLLNGRFDTLVYETERQ